jgi:hypothetical protein
MATTTKPISVLSWYGGIELTRSKCNIEEALDEEGSNLSEEEKLDGDNNKV